MVSSYLLPDECWEIIFKFIIDDDDYDTRHSRVTRKFLHLNSLSLVSKQFLSITNRLRFSLSLAFTLPFDSYKLTVLHSFFKRFTNLNSLNLTWCRIDLSNFLIKISCFPLNQLTSLNLSNQDTIPANGLRAFSQKITTLTSLTCSQIDFLDTSDLFLIAECFPLLEELDLCWPLRCKNYGSYVDGVEALSIALIKLRKVNITRFPINNQSLFHLFNNCKYLEEVIMFGCDEITSEGLASAVRERSTLRSLSFSNMKVREVFTTSQFIDSLVSLKGLTSLVLDHLNISDELLLTFFFELQ
ncbi:F-box/LRR-repeat protein [Trifolium repens]|nr:F-box/LRR-repeat protein [Trifolium repens]